MFGKNLRELSKRYPSVSELARQLGINRTQFNRYLSGESFPRPDVLDRICSFFDVDARILLEPVNSFNPRGSLMTGALLKDFVGSGVDDIPQDVFPDGFYRFSRRSFLSETQYVIGLVYVFRSEGHTMVRGFEAREAIAMQGLPMDSQSREFRGFFARQEDGLIALISRRHSMTCSLNYLSRVASFENNFWVGYVARTVRETATGSRAVRMVYEHLGRDFRKALQAARGAGFVSKDDLMPFHRQLLQPDDPFR